MTSPPSAAERARLAALARYARLDPFPSRALALLASLAARLCDAPIAFVNFVGERTVVPAALVGADLGEHDRAASFCARTVEGDGLLVVPDARLDPRFRDSPFVAGEGGVRFYAGAPVRTPDGRPIGTVCVFDRAPREHAAPGDFAVLGTLAALTTDELELRRATLELARRRAALERARGRLAALVAVSALAERAPSPVDLAARTAEVLAEAVGASWHGLAEAREGRLAWLALAARGGPQGGAAARFETPDGRVAPTWTHGRGDGPVFSDALGAAWVPLGPSGAGTFVLALARPSERKGAWSRADRAALAAGARSVRLALAHGEEAERWRRQARTDPLTGLLNRRAWDEDVRAWAGRGRSFGVVAIDLDDFKAVNDTQGHERGDALLRLFARGLAAAFRPQDGVYRLGGDEFAVLVHGADEWGFVAAFEVEALTRVAVAAEVMRAGGFAHVGASSGAALWPRDGRSSHAVLAAADARLYRAKRRRGAQR